MPSSPRRSTFGAARKSSAGRSAEGQNREHDARMAIGSFAPKAASSGDKITAACAKRSHSAAIFWTLRTGSPWRDLPERYGPHTTVYNRYNRWAKAGVWLCIFETLAERSPDSLHLEGAPNYTANAEPNWSDRTYGQSVDRYYGY